MKTAVGTSQRQNPGAPIVDPRHTSRRESSKGIPNEWGPSTKQNIDVKGPKAPKGSEGLQPRPTGVVKPRDRRICDLREDPGVPDRSESQGSNVAQRPGTRLAMAVRCIKGIQPADQI